MLEQMDSIYSDFQCKVATLDKQADVLALKASVLGKKGALTEILKSLKTASVEEKKAIGPKSNQVKQDIEKLVQENVVSKEEVSQYIAEYRQALEQGVETVPHLIPPGQHQQDFPINWERFKNTSWDDEVC